jgi:flagellar protein FlgJ
MEIGPLSGNASFQQMQARFEMAQASRILAQAQTEAGKAETAMKGTALPGEKKAAYDKLVKVSRDFESIFLGYMLKSMRDTVPKDSLIDAGQEQELFQSMHDEELAKSLAQAGGIGLGSLMVQQLKKDL